MPEQQPTAETTQLKPEDRDALYDQLAAMLCYEKHHQHGGEFCPNCRSRAGTIHGPLVLGVVNRVVAEHEARARYFAFWHYFLRLPFGGPFSDLVQREAMRLRALCPPPAQTSPAGPVDAPPTEEISRGTDVAPSAGEPAIEHDEWCPKNGCRCGKCGPCIGPPTCVVVRPGSTGARS